MFGTKERIELGFFKLGDFGYQGTITRKGSKKVTGKLTSKKK